MNDRGDVVGFADADNGSGSIHAILWKGAEATGAVDLGVLPGYVSSEAYGVNDDRVVFGLLYDRQERTFPFRWSATSATRPTRSPRATSLPSGGRGPPRRC